MKELGRSIHSVDVIKKKSSSGCLIIKKKVADSSGGVKGFSDSSSRSLFNSTKEKKRPRLIRSDSESSDEFTEPYRRKIDKFHNGSVFSNSGFIENRESESYKRVNKYEFDEYDGFHERMNMKNVNDHKHRFNSHSQNRDQNDSGIGSSRRVVYDNRSTNFGAKNSRFTREIKNRYMMDGDESNLPDEPIRLQGKNGVLKVMVKKHKPINVSHQSYHKPAEPEDWKKEHRPEIYIKKQPNLSHKNHDFWENSNKKKAAIDSSMYSASKLSGKQIFSKKSEPELTDDDDSDSSLPVRSPSVRNSVIEKTVKSYKKIVPQTKNVVIPVTGKVKETKVKRGSGTEKQLLREKIRSMLLKAGWHIDYRPRRNRDYLDAVYINPAGTAYWSIIKAYEALQKEEKDHSQIGGEFTPLPIETLSKLTRQTRKKIEREMKKKRQDEGKSENDDSNDEYYEKTDKKRYFGVNSHMVHARKSNKFGRCTLLIRSDGKKSENDQFVPYSGKRTLLSWLIDSKTVQMSEKVEYMNKKKTRVMQEGWITNEGIHCGCCSKILTVLKFELHAGSKIRQPFLNIFVQSGKSLMQLLIDAWNKQGEIEKKGFFGVDVNGDDPNDDTCGLCGDGGDLICCDGCPSTFHQNCLGIQMLPQGDWHCPNCSCKYCEMASTSVRTENQHLVCYCCEKKYHESCSLDLDDKPIDLNGPNLSFCGHKCQQVYNQFQKLIGVKHELESGFSWSVIRRSDISSDTLSPTELSERVKCNSKLAVALSVIDECFLPVVDRRSGINLIHNVVYNCGSNLSRLNYSGFYTAILERGDELICAASIRIHGTQLAEMPFIGTRHMYRRQGMCRRLLSAIESVLSSLYIEKLIIPAIAEHLNTWTDVFGFNPLKESHKQELKSINMLVFPGTDMLQKPLVSEKGSPLYKTSIIQMEKSQPNSSFDDDDKKFIGKSGPTDSDSQDHSNVVLDDSINCVKNDEIMQNGEVGTEYFDSIEAKSQHLDSIEAKSQHLDSIEAKSQDFDSIPAKSGVLDGNEITDKIANADSKVDGNGNSIPPQETDFLLCDTETAERPKESVSLDEQSDSKVEEYVVKTAEKSKESVSVDAKSDSKVEEFVVKTAEKESDSISADLDSMIQVIDVKNCKITDVNPLESHVLNDSISTGEEEK